MVADETTAVLVLKQLIQAEVPFFLMVLLLVFLDFGVAQSSQEECGSHEGSLHQ